MKHVVGNLMFLLSAVAVSFGEGGRQKCAARKYDQDSVVCVCSSNYCDDIGTIEAPEPGACLRFESNMAGLRLEQQPCNLTAQNETSALLRISVDPSVTFQEILGFGGSVTDSVGFNLASLSSGTQETLLSSYFGPKGIGYTFIRMPLGGSDFSPKLYTYDDVDNDTTLSHFNLTEEDYTHKIPYLKRIIDMSPAPIKLITAIWYVPSWMTENRADLIFPPVKKVKEENYQTLADYMIRYLDSYKSEGLELWALSAQNEPQTAFYIPFIPTALAWTPEEQAQFLEKNLIPTLKSNGYDDLKLILVDDQRPFVSSRLDELESHPDIMNRASILGVHWYLDDEYPASTYLDVKRRYPNLTIISTEASITPILFTKPVRLGYWGNAQRYAKDIIEDLNVFVSAWVDWNMALNLEGGPTFISNFLDSPIIVNASADEFYKQPAFYVMAHFSKFVPPGSVRIGLKIEFQPNLWIGLNPFLQEVQAVAFLTPEKTIVVVLHNRNYSPIGVQLQIENIGSTDIMLSANSINTLVFNKSA